MSGKGRSEARSVARLGAVQALYQIEMIGADTGAVIEEFLEHRLGETLDGVALGDADRELFRTLVAGTMAERDDLDDMLAAVLAEGWPVERLEAILRAILRCGAYEIGYCDEIPPKVSITEYVRLTETFFEGKEPGMANAVLDKLAHSLWPEEMEATPPCPANSN
ncbi:MAG: transcription antitermination factor NusB [Pseudomonadota bacterium]